MESKHKTKYDNIFDAVAEGSVKDVRFFLELGADINATDGTEYEFTPLFYAAASNPNVEVLKYLVETGADVNMESKFGYTPLHCAARFNTNIDICCT